MRNPTMPLELTPALVESDHYMSNSFTTHVVLVNEVDDIV